MLIINSRKILEIFYVDLDAEDVLDASVGEGLSTDQKFTVGAGAGGFDGLCNLLRARY